MNGTKDLLRAKARLLADRDKIEARGVQRSFYTPTEQADLMRLWADILHIDRRILETVPQRGSADLDARAVSSNPT